MNNQRFLEIVDHHLNNCKDVLNTKKSIYTEGDDADRLGQFKSAAALLNTTPLKALAGMMSKHTTLIYSIINSGGRIDSYQFDEAITDQINYLLLLKALVIEEGHYE